jgi:hypothetical protein
MIRHLTCLTIDTDPDGMTAKIMDRDSLSLAGAREHGMHLRGDPIDVIAMGAIPLTWFIRVEGEIRTVMGNALARMDGYYPIWEQARRAGDAFGWHPIYTVTWGVTKSQPGWLIHLRPLRNFFPCGNQYPTRLFNLSPFAMGGLVQSGHVRRRGRERILLLRANRSNLPAIRAARHAGFSLLWRILTPMRLGCEKRTYGSRWMFVIVMVYSRH